LGRRAALGRLGHGFSAAFSGFSSIDAELMQYRIPVG
jgi:hypothetical protein